MQIARRPSGGNRKSKCKAPAASPWPSLSARGRAHMSSHILLVSLRMELHSTPRDLLFVACSQMVLVLWLFMLRNIISMTMVNIMSAVITRPVSLLPLAALTSKLLCVCNIYIYIYIYIYIHTRIGIYIFNKHRGQRRFRCSPPAAERATPHRTRPAATPDSLGCDVHTHARAQDSSYNISVEEMGTVGSL